MASSSKRVAWTVVRDDGTSDKWQDVVRPVAEVSLQEVKLRRRLQGDWFSSVESLATKRLGLTLSLNHITGLDAIGGGEDEGQDGSQSSWLEYGIEHGVR